MAGPGTGDVGSMRNLGPRAVELFAGVGVTTAEQVRELGAPFAFRLLRHRWGRQADHPLWLYAIAGAIQDRDIHSFSPDEKAALLAAAADDPEPPRDAAAPGRDEV